ncbi:MAG: SMP-30/gluconolactonase/LRE family protein [Rhodobacteraceae bacterium]|nr:SMP-30/gluconolactonase/LRE family protein [Paracoccaceae bacterium]
MTEDSPYEIHDPRFRRLIHPSARLERIATGFRWAEGPVWFPAMGCLLFSDIPENRMMRWTEDGQLGLFRAPADFANGNTRDRQGRLVTCHHGTRSVVRTEHDGTRTILADRFAGQRLNSPNDVVVRSDGSIWFTDPTYGIMSDYEGHAAPREQAANRVYRIDPASGEVAAVSEDFVQPNGLAFSPAEDILYVAESGSSHDPAVPAVIRAYPVAGDRLGPGRDFATIDSGLPDGFRLDRSGNLWSSAADGVHVFSPEGVLLGKIRTPETVANLTFGGRRGHRLFIAATTSVYAVYVEAAGAV